MPLLDLYQAYGIEVASEGHKHARPGWINTVCPFCTGTEGFHLGFNTRSTYYFCWRCGPHPIAASLVKLLRISYTQADELIKVYRLRSKTSFGQKEPTQVKVGGKPFKFPSDVIDLYGPHERYLKGRGFDSGMMASIWQAKGTGPVSKLDGIPYDHRILIPIYWQDKLVSFQTRDYTGKQERYMACPEIREIVHHKHILYGHRSLWAKSRAIIVEGVFDVWRLGVNACATLGTGYTPQQMRILGQLFHELVIVFDPEPAAQSVAKKLKEELQFRGLKVQIYNDLKTDPGDMSEDDAQHLLKELKFA